MASTEAQKAAAPAFRGVPIPTVFGGQQTIAEHPMLLGESVKKGTLYLGPVSKLKEALELRTMKGLERTSPISHNTYPGQLNSICHLASRTKFTSVARSAFSMLGEEWIRDVGVNNPYDEIVKFTIDFLKEGGKYEVVESIGVGVAKEKAMKEYARYYFEDALVTAISPMDPLAKYALDVLNESKPEFLKEAIVDVESDGSYTTARYAIELLLRDGRKADLLEAGARLSKRYASLTSSNSIHPPLFDFDIVRLEALRETANFLKNFSPEAAITVTSA
jgi:hypothetical protein